MTAKFVIEDERHAEQLGEFTSFEAAVAELQRLAEIPWDHAPNVAPCKNWKNCGRRYELVEFDATSSPWSEIRRQLMLEVDSQGARWHRTS